MYIYGHLTGAGDGGIDGRAIIGSVKVFVQAKRYSNYVSAAHVKEFSEICSQARRKGLFVHTGKTGQKARNFADFSDIDIVSGSRMLALFTGKEFEPAWDSNPSNG